MRIWNGILIPMLWAASGMAWAGLLDVSHERGFYTNVFDLVLSSDEPGTAIRYSLNNKAKPTAGSMLYTGPIPITETSFIRIYASNPTNAVHETHTYIFPEDVWDQPQMSAHVGDNPNYASRLVPALLSLPTISLVSENINGEGHVGAVLETSVEIFSADGALDIQEHCGTKTWGGSPQNPKKSYRLEFKPAFGPPKLRAPNLFDGGVTNPIPAAASFDHLLLRAGSQDGLNGERGNETHASFVRNRVIFDMEMALGNPAPHGRFVHVYLNGMYNGQYHLMERVHASWMASYYGGTKEDYDVRKSGEYLDGDTTFYDQMLVKADQHATAPQYDALRDYLNTKQMADYLVLGTFLGTFDFAEDFNSLGGANRIPGNGGYQFFMWDKDLAMGNPGAFAQWQVDRIRFLYGPSPAALDASPEFLFERKDSVWCSMQESGAPATVAGVKELWKARTDEIRLSLVAEAGRWGSRTFEETFGPNEDDEFQAENVPNWHPDAHWEAELARMDTWFNTRTADVLEFHAEEGTLPTRKGMNFSHPDDVVLPRGTVITISNPNVGGTIYHDLDGRDPRGFGGGLSGTRIQSTQVPLNGLTKRVMARTYHGAGQWSPACMKTFYVEQDWDDFSFTEIHYNANAAICGGAVDRDTEFVEFANVGDKPFDLSGCSITRGVSFTFPLGTVLQPQEVLVLAEDEATFETRYGFAPFGQYGGKLDNGGETLAISDRNMREVFTFRYNDGSSWPQSPDGEGPSLELLDLSLDANQPWAWGASAINCGTPGVLPFSCGESVEDVVINEIMYKPNMEGDFGALLVGDWLELYNRSPFPVNVAGWTLMHETNTFALGPGVIPAGGYAVVAEATESWLAYPGVTPIIPVTGMQLDNGGNGLLLWNAAGCLVTAFEYNDKAPWPIEPDTNGSSLSLLNPQFDPANPASWGASGNRLGTPGAPNGVGLCGTPPSVVINEINYKSSLTADSGDWVELYNAGGSTINLSGWMFADFLSVYRIPNGTYLSAGHYLVIASDLTLFRQQFPGVRAVGSTLFGLSSNGENVGLFTSEGCLVDFVNYDDDIPWEIGAKATGATLALIHPSRDNSLPWSWLLSTEVPVGLHGTPGAANGLQNLCQPPPPFVVINEMNVDSTPFADVGDWIELHNPGLSYANISNWRVYDDQTRIDIPGSTFIAPGGYIVLAENVFAFQARFPGIANVINSNNGFSLASSGERVLLATDQGCVVDEVAYDNDPPWDRDGIGFGPSLVLSSPYADNALPGSWSPSLGLGTPGQPNSTSACASPSNRIVINEISRGGPGGNWIELYNNGSTAWDFLGSHLGIGTRYMFLGEVVLPAQQFHVLVENPVAFAAAHPGVSIGGPLSLAIEPGAAITLYDDGHCPLDVVLASGAAWPDAPIIGLASPGADNSLPANWDDSLPVIGTPGGPNRVDPSPGGVVQGLQMWVDAATGVTTDAAGELLAWRDQSPFNRNPFILGDPTVEPGGEFNGHPAVRFDGIGDYVGWNNFASDFTGGDFFIVWRHDERTGNFGTYQFSGSPYTLGTDTRPGGYIRSVFGHQGIQEVAHPNGLLYPHINNPTINGGGGWAFRKDGVIRATANEVVNFGTSVHRIGRSGNHFMRGLVAEAFLYDRSLPAAERRAVETYLSVRHGITIPVNRHDFYSHINHPDDLVGLGRDSLSGLDQSLSRSVNADALIELSVSNPLVDGDYLVVGSDGGLSTTAALPGPPGIHQRIQRTWCLQRTQTTESFRLSFDLSGLEINLTDPADFNLLVDFDADGDFRNATVRYDLPAQLSGSSVTFDEVDLHDGATFALGTVKGAVAVPLQIDPMEQEVLVGSLARFNVYPTNMVYTFDGAVTTGLLQPNGSFFWVPNSTHLGGTFQIPIVGTRTEANIDYRGTAVATIRVVDTLSPAIVIDDERFIANQGVHFNATPGSTYQLQVCYDLTDGSWIPLQNLTANSASHAFIPNLAGRAGVFRVVLVP